MKKAITYTGDQICRSLLQKAIRRGAVDVAESATIHLIQKGETAWLKNRLGVIAFEEAWAFAAKLQFTTNEQLLIKQYKELASSSKNKNAAGLGSLGYELSKGAGSVLVKNEPTNKHVKIIAEAVRRPDDFWRWVKQLKSDQEGLGFLEKAESGFKLAGWPWDKAFAIASAYLFVTDDVPVVTVFNYSPPASFPLWVAIDKHTTIGKRALAKCAEKFNLDKTTLGWIQFYLESAKCANLQPSPWWEREKSWRLETEGVGRGKAEIIWRDSSIFLHELLASQEAALKNELEHSSNQYQSTLKTQGNLI
ncbi:hypothetical protein [Pseudomonas zeae]|uniref:Uncharacterized protein n=1 Tax=Pseudomonas zeae TaxID=2745510 RepID=A0ABU5BE23_9PSED|nr:hypothetical protein [Pseudomonas zeae]MDX9674781.1 hypothetical protein [Pseudomonas zeae]